MTDLRNNISGRKANLVLALLCLAYMLDFADRMVISSLFPLIKAEWNVSDQDLGMLVSIVSLFIGLCAIPVGLIVDRWSRRRMVALMVFVWSIATLVSAFAENFQQLVFIRAITGLGEAGYGPASVAVIATLYPMSSRAKVVGIWDAFAPLGAAIGFIAGGIIGHHLGWRNALGILAVPGIILSVFFWFTYDYKTISLSGDKQEVNKNIDFKGVGKAIIGLFKVKTLWFLYFAFALNFAVSSSVMTWFPSYLTRFYDLTEKSAGMYSGGLAMLALIGAPAGGILADRWMRKRKNARMLLAAITSLLSAIFLAVALLFPGSLIAVPFVILFGCMLVAFLAPATASIGDVVHPGIRALSFGVSVFIMNMFGAFWAPVVIGGLSDSYGLNIALFLLPLLSVSAAVLFYFGSKKYVADASKYNDL